MLTHPSRCFDLPPQTNLPSFLPSSVLSPLSFILTRSTPCYFPFSPFSPHPGKDVLSFYLFSKLCLSAMPAGLRYFPVQLQRQSGHPWTIHPASFLNTLHPLTCPRSSKVFWASWAQQKRCNCFLDLSVSPSTQGPVFFPLLVPAGQQKCVKLKKAVKDEQRAVCICYQGVSTFIPRGRCVLPLGNESRWNKSSCTETQGLVMWCFFF